MATDSDADAIVGEIKGAFATCGHLDYGENINMQEHMLQTACLAESEGADDRLIVAALLHDYGHLICNMPNNTFAAGADNYHERIGAEAMSGWFDEDIVNAVRMHVDAKRYLCARNPKYMENLSAASRLTLAVQGGPMNEEEMREFELDKGHRMALRVRIYDDLGKRSAMKRPELDHYLPKIRACLR